MDEDERRTREQLVLHEALVKAMDRRGEVFQVIEDSENLDEAIQRVGQLLDLGELGSRVVLDMQARRFTRDQRQAIAPMQKNLDQGCPMGVQLVAYANSEQARRTQLPARAECVTLADSGRWTTRDRRGNHACRDEGGS